MNEERRRLEFHNETSYLDDGSVFRLTHGHVLAVLGSGPPARLQDQGSGSGGGGGGGGGRAAGTKGGRNLKGLLRIIRCDNR